VEVAIFDGNPSFGIDPFTTEEEAKKALLVGTSAKTWEELPNSHIVTVEKNIGYWKEHILDVTRVTSKTQSKYWQEMHHCRVLEGYDELLAALSRSR